jgi:hypothetical protein
LSFVQASWHQAHIYPNSILFVWRCGLSWFLVVLVFFPFLWILIVPIQNGIRQPLFKCSLICRCLVQQESLNKHDLFTALKSPEWSYEFGGPRNYCCLGIMICHSMGSLYTT